MKVTVNVLKKAAVITVLSTCLISVFVSTAFAAVNASSLTKKIGNELQAEFNVTEADAVDTVVLSWDEAALDIALESYDLTKDEAKSVTYYVSPGVENDDDLTVSVLLKMPATSAAALDELTVDGNAVSASFTDSGFSYFALNEGLEIAVGDATYSDSFNIAFNQTTTAGTPFTASLIAVKEAAGKPAPQFLVTDVDSSDGMYAFTVHDVNLPADWHANRTAILFSTDGGVTYSEVAPSNVIIHLDGSMTFPLTEADLSSAGYQISYKFQSAGYEDAELVLGLA